MVEYNLDWLKKKGFFIKSIPLEVRGNKVLVDEKNLLAYVEVFSNEEIEKIKRELLSQKVRYIWFFFPSTGKLKVFRRIGEVKWFYYSSRMRSDYLKSRVDKLNKFSPDNMNILFDIRDIVEKFYWQLWEHRILMARSIKELKEDKDKLLVVQHLIDRLIFFYFLGQLKLVKIKNEEREWVLDRRNTREFFKWICDQLSESDLQKFLNKIFFDVLGKVEERGFVSEEFNIGNERFFIVSPCLNGGLFIEEEIEGIPERKIKISGIKKLILEVLNNYNWIIGEELPEEEDVIGDLTPEIIGHIYEKFVVSLEQIGLGKIKLKDVKTVKQELRYGRKKIGAYYTPEEITNYISMNTIYPFLKDRLRERFGKSGEILLDNIFKKNSFNKQELEIIKHLYFEILTKIKICDNACGSGSFLIAAGDVLLRLYSRILKILEDNLSDDRDVKEVLDGMRESPTRNYYIVRQIIVNNLYGVDIMEGAVEIAKLRFWLWLISQINPKKIGVKRIETLPNLDFNLMAGNSLIGFVDIEDIEFDFIRKQRTLSYWLGENKVEWLKNLAKKKREFKTLPSHEAVKLKEKLNKEIYKARKFLNERFYDMLKAKRIKISKEEFLNLKPFHWGFEFYDVFDLEKPKEERGFDIIIGNPPYGNILSKVEKEIYSVSYESYVGEIAGIFVERSIDMLKSGGYFSYIITFAITFNRNLSKTRKIIYENFDRCTILTFDRDRCRLFEGMSQSVSVILCNRKGGKNCDFYTSKFFREMPSDFRKIPTIRSNDYLLGKFVGSSFDVPHRLPKIGEKISESILQKLIRHPQRLGDVLGKGSKIWIRTSGNYWYNAFDRKPYGGSSKIKSIFIDDKYLHFALVLINSSLYYFWFRIFGDGRDMNSDIYEAFPLPKERDIERYNHLLIHVSKKFMKDLFSVFDSKRKRFLTSEVKGSIDMLDFIVGKYIYNLSYLELNYVLDYDKEIRTGNKLPNPYHRLMEYMIFLNATEERRNKEKELIEFIDKRIIDSLVYELYFKEKFHEDKLYPKPKEYLLELVSRHLKPINHDRWSELYWKNQLEGKLSKEEENEIRVLEEVNLKTIKEVVEKIKNDKKIMEQIKRIKSHPWVRVIEGRENDKY